MIKLPKHLSDIIIHHYYGDKASGEIFISEDGGHVTLDLYVVPGKTVEHINLNFIATKSNVTFEEIINDEQANS